MLRIGRGFLPHPRYPGITPISLVIKEGGNSRILVPLNNCPAPLGYRARLFSWFGGQNNLVYPVNGLSIVVQISMVPWLASATQCVWSWRVQVRFLDGPTFFSFFFLTFFLFPLLFVLLIWFFSFFLFHYFFHFLFFFFPVYSFVFFQCSFYFLFLVSLHWKVSTSNFRKGVWDHLFLSCFTSLLLLLLLLLE